MRGGQDSLYRAVMSEEEWVTSNAVRIDQAKVDGWAQGATIEPSIWGKARDLGSDRGYRVANVSIRR
jgi:hypothetical protein